MTNITKDLKAILAAVQELFRPDSNYPEHQILSNAEPRIKQTGDDGNVDGIEFYEIFLDVPTNVYAAYEDVLDDIENGIITKLRPILRKYPKVRIKKVVVSPKLSDPGDSPSTAFQISGEKLIEALQSQRDLLISVATGGPLINTVNDDFTTRQDFIERGLSERGIENAIQYEDLWEWHEEWKCESLSSWRSRRAHINALVNPLIKKVRRLGKTSVHALFAPPTGWAHVDINIAEMRTRLAHAQTEVQFQEIGLLCRETLITLGQMVYDPQAHSSTHEGATSKTDAKRMLDAFLAAKLPGKTNENARRLTKSSVDYANEITHKRTAVFRQAAMCVEATTSVVNLIAIISGQRDPQTQSKA